MWHRVNTDMGASAAPDPDAQLMLRVRDGDEEVSVSPRKASQLSGPFSVSNGAGASGFRGIGAGGYLRIYRSRATYEPTARFTTWMFRIATHLAINWLRDQKNERTQERLDEDRGSDTPVREVADRKPSVEQRMVFQARMQEVRDAIAKLPEKQRAAVLMHKYEEMEYSQIAAVLECSESAVKSLLFRAYETLRAKLAHMVMGGVR